MSLMQRTCVDLLRICKNTEGATAVEFGLTAPGFLMLLTGSIIAGLVLWTQLGLQHGVERAARCASVNSSLCGTVAAIQDYAAKQALGLNPPSSMFTVTSPACGNQVSANYTFDFITKYFGLPSVSLNAQACFPK
jgi:Flp pilus assembly protein TadG